MGGGGDVCHVPSASGCVLVAINVDASLNTLIIPDESPSMPPARRKALTS